MNPCGVSKKVVIQMFKSIYAFETICRHFFIDQVRETIEIGFNVLSCVRTKLPE